MSWTKIKRGVQCRIQLDGDRMEVLVIPDIHLKPWMFKQADNLLCHKVAELAVCLMDIPDDWDKQFDVELYSLTFDEAIHFAKKYHDVDAVLETINSLGRLSMWNDASPNWLRPQYGNVRMYKPRKLLQVVGHTPMKKIERKGNVISCDVFSTYRDGRQIGTEEFLLLDTETWEYTGVKG